MADVFGDTPQEEQITLGLNDLVGEGKKYSDPDQLATAYANADAFVEKLKKENADLRAFKDAADANNNNQQPPQAPAQEPVTPADPQGEPPKQPKGDEDFRSQIRKEVEALNEEQRGALNIDTTARKLVEVHGSEAKANEAVRAKAAELGVTVDWLRDTAARSPEAFYRTMGITQSSSTRTPSPNPDVRLPETGNVRNFEFFDKMRKENPKLYYDRLTQSEMFAEAKRQGADFYKR